MNWNDYYIKQTGGADCNTFKGALYQRGYGLGVFSVDLLNG